MKMTEKQIGFIAKLADRSKSGVFELLAKEHGFFNSTAARERCTLAQASKTIDRLLEVARG